MNIHYVVAVYLGPRRLNHGLDPFHFTRQHLKFLQNSNCTQVTFVCNQYEYQYDKWLPIIVHEANLPMPANVVFRNNIDCSYGAWEYAVIQQINQNFDYHFLIEDDFIPTNQNFAHHFIQKMKPNVAYTCSKLFLHPLHPAVSNGLLSHQIAQKMFQEKRKIFKLNHAVGTSKPIVVGIRGVPWPLPNHRRIQRGLDYSACERNQMHFLDFFKEKGYDLDHVADLMSVPFKHHFQQIHQDYGSELLPPAIVPMDYLAPEPPKQPKIIKLQ